jgi:hypothetical protein
MTTALGSVNGPRSFLSQMSRAVVTDAPWKCRLQVERKEEEVKRERERGGGG